MTSSAGSGPVSQQQITGTLTIEVASETELRGRLELQSVGDFCGALTRAKISSPFALKLVSRSDAVPEGY